MKNLLENLGILALSSALLAAFALPRSIKSTPPQAQRHPKPPISPAPPPLTTPPTPIPPQKAYIPLVLSLILTLLLALLAPLVILYQSQKLPTLITLLFFLPLPLLAYAYLWRFNHLTQPERPPIHRKARQS